MKREIEKEIPIKEEIIMVLIIFIIGLCLGTFSKYLDFHQASLPFFLKIIDKKWDLHNYLGTFAPWLMIALCLSLYANKPRNAAIFVFVFFIAMVSSYYLYCYYICGFYSLSYIMVWICLTILSPFLAYICWFALGSDHVACLISSLIIGVFIHLSFSYGIFYLDIKSYMNIFMLFIILFMLHKDIKKDLLIVLGGIIFSMPIHGLYLV